jgi:hypothetical protein
VQLDMVKATAFTTLQCHQSFFPYSTHPYQNISCAISFDQYRLAMFARGLRIFYCLYTILLVFCLYLRTGYGGPVSISAHSMLHKTGEELGRLSGYRAC